jgi:NADPH:quinone reductase-like Zn-dependent oxidoreductase
VSLTISQSFTLRQPASKSKHPILIEYGARPIDYHTQGFVEVIRQAEPNGLDAVFDGMGGDYLDRGFSLLRRGGKWVHYGNPLSVSGLLLLLAKFTLFNVLPNGKSLKVYGTGLFEFNRRPFLEDWAKLFKLLEEGKIKPVIMKKLPILEAARGNELLEGGQVIGNVVLLASELL